MTGLLQFVRANWPPHREPLTWHGCWLVQHPAGAQPSPSWTLRCIVGRLGGRHAMDRRGEARAHARLHGSLLTAPSPTLTSGLSFAVIYTFYRVPVLFPGSCLLCVALLYRRCYAQSDPGSTICLIHQCGPSRHQLLAPSPLAYIPRQSTHLFKQSATSASRSKASSWNVNLRYA